MDCCMDWHQVPPIMNTSTELQCGLRLIEWVSEGKNTVIVLTCSLADVVEIVVCFVIVWLATYIDWRMCERAIIGRILVMIDVSHTCYRNIHAALLVRQACIVRELVKKWNQWLWSQMDSSRYSSSLTVVCPPYLLINNNYYLYDLVMLVLTRLWRTKWHLHSYCSHGDPVSVVIVVCYRRHICDVIDMPRCSTNAY